MTNIRHFSNIVRYSVASVAVYSQFRLSMMKSKVSALYYALEGYPFSPAQVNARLRPGHFNFSVKKYTLVLKSHLRVPLQQEQLRQEEVAVQEQPWIGWSLCTRGPKNCSFDLRITSPPRRRRSGDGGETLLLPTNPQPTTPLSPFSAHLSSPATNLQR